MGRKLQQCDDGLSGEPGSYSGCFDREGVGSCFLLEPNGHAIYPRVTLASFPRLACWVSSVPRRPSSLASAEVIMSKSSTASYVLSMIDMSKVHQIGTTFDIKIRMIVSRCSVHDPDVQVAFRDSVLAVAI